MHFWLARSWIHLIRLLAKLSPQTVELNILLHTHNNIQYQNQKIKKTKYEDILSQ